MTKASGRRQESLGTEDESTVIEHTSISAALARKLAHAALVVPHAEALACLG